MGLDRLAWRTLASRPLRSLLTIAGIALGVAVLCASLTLGAALDAAVDRTVRDMVGHIIAAANQTPVSFFRKLVASGFSFSKFVNKDYLIEINAIAVLDD